LPIPRSRLLIEKIYNSSTYLYSYYTMKKEEGHRVYRLVYGSRELATNS